MKIFLIGVLLLTLRGVSCEDDVEENGEEEVETVKKFKTPFIDITNYTQFLQNYTKLAIFVRDDHCEEGNDCAFSNYSRVAEELDGQLMMGWLNFTINKQNIFDFTKKAPSIIYFINKTGYKYKKDLSYEKLSAFFINFADEEYVGPKESLIFITVEEFDNKTKDIPLCAIASYSSTISTDPSYNGRLARLRTLASKLKPHNITVFMIECFNQTDFCSQLKFESVFWVSLLRHGRPYHVTMNNYQNIEALTKYILKNKKIGSTLITRYKQGIYEMDKQFSYVPSVFLGVFKSNTSLFYKNFEELSNIYRENSRFFHTFDEEIGKLYGCEKPDCFLPVFFPKLVSQYDMESVKEKSLSEEELTDFEKLEDFFKTFSRPLVGYLTSYSHIGKLYSTFYPRGILYLEVDFNTLKYQDTLYYLKILWEVAKDHRNITFLIADKEDNSEKLTSLNLDDSGNEADLIIESINNYTYIMNTPFTEEQVRRYIEAFEKNNVRPFLKSQPVPAYQYDDHGIRILVNSYFYDVVFDESYDVLILFYVDWCEYCKMIKPIYEELANKYKSNMKLMIAKFDCTKNQPPPEYIIEKGYPTIYFATSDRKKDPISYNFERGYNVESILKFVEEHWTVSKPTLQKDPSHKDDL